MVASVRDRPQGPCLLVCTPLSRPLCVTDGVWQSDDRPLSRSDCSESCCGFVWVSLSVRALALRDASCRVVSGPDGDEPASLQPTAT